MRMSDITHRNDVQPLEPESRFFTTTVADIVPTWPQTPRDGNRGVFLLTNNVCVLQTTECSGGEVVTLKPFLQTRYKERPQFLHLSGFWICAVESIEPSEISFHYFVVSLQFSRQKKSEY